METRRVTIESPPGNTLTVHIEAPVVEKFVRFATDKEGAWRGKRKTFQDSLEAAVSVAFNEFVEKFDYLNK
jgi:hypothetical protein